MRLTSFTDYGLRALMRMVGNPDRAFTTAGPAIEFSLSRTPPARAILILAGAGTAGATAGPNKRPE